MNLQSRDVGCSCNTSLSIKFLLAASKKSIMWIICIVIPLSVCCTDPVFAHAPHDAIQEVEVSPEFSVDNTVFTIVRDQNLLVSMDRGISWKRVVKGLDNKYDLASIHIAPKNRKFIYLSSYGDGIYKSEDGGYSWSKVNNRLGSLHISLVKVSPHKKDGSVVLAAGSESGLFITENGGTTWREATGIDATITSISFFPHFPQRIAVGTDDGRVYFSSDLGFKWNLVFQEEESSRISVIAVSPAFQEDSLVVLGTHKAGVFRTTDGGGSFAPVNVGLSDMYVTDLVMSPNFPLDGTIFVASWHDGVFVSKNSADNWESYDSGLGKDEQADRLKKPHFRDLEITASFEHDRTLFLGAFSGLFRSANGGSEWEEIETLPHHLIIGLSAASTARGGVALVVTTYLGGAFVSYDGGDTWNAANNGLEEVRFSGIARLYDVRFSPDFSTDETLFSGQANNVLRSTDAGRHWDRMPLVSSYFGGQRFFAALLYRLPQLPMGLREKIEPLSEVHRATMLAVSPSYDSDRVLFVGTPEGHIFKSSDKENAVSRISTIEPGIRFLVISPGYRQDSTLYAVGRKGKGIYRSSDGGLIWASVWSKSAMIDTSIRALNLVVSPSYAGENVVFAGTNRGLMKSTNQGIAWTRVFGIKDVEEGFIESIALSPNYDRDGTLILSVRGKGVFMSTNGGHGFVRVGDTLTNDNHPLASMNHFPETSSMALVFSPEYSLDQTIYGHSGLDLFRTLDGGESWEVMPLPFGTYKMTPIIWRVLTTPLVVLPLIVIVGLTFVFLITLKWRTALKAG